MTSKLFQSKTSPVKSPLRDWLKNGARWAGRLLLITVLTLLLLEGVTQIVWWPQETVLIFGRTLTLLPQPLISEAHRQLLEEWAQNPNSYLRFDPLLGWNIRPNSQAENQGQTYTSNSIGIRSLHEYSLVKPSGHLRIATFGPSFTHGDEVSDEATWQVQMEQAQPNLEVMNWGVGGYGTDQALLRYRTAGQHYRPDIVIIGFEENNLQRNVNRFRPFLHPSTQLTLTKPVFVLDKAGELRLIENPFQEFSVFKETLLNHPDRFLDLVCPHDAHCDRAMYQPWPGDVFTSFRFLRTLTYEIRRASQPEEAPPVRNVGGWLMGEVEQLNWHLLRRFIEEITGNGSVPVVVAFPERSSIEAYEQGYAGVTFYHTAITFLRQQGLHVVELPPAFVQHRTTHNLGYDAYYAADGGHFNDRGNAIVSQAVSAYLCQQNLLPDCA